MKISQKDKRRGRKKKEHRKNGSEGRGKEIDEEKKKEKK